MQKTSTFLLSLKQFYIEKKKTLCFPISLFIWSMWMRGEILDLWHKLVKYRCGENYALRNFCAAKFPSAKLPEANFPVANQPVTPLKMGKIDRTKVSLLTGIHCIGTLLVWHYKRQKTECNANIILVPILICNRETSLTTLSIRKCAYYSTDSFYLQSLNLTANLTKLEINKTKKNYIRH